MLGEPVAVVNFPTTFPPSAAGTAPPDISAPSITANLAMLADRVLLRQFAPAAVLINDQGDILYISGRTGKYLEPPAGQINWNILAMAREGLRVELLGALQQALHQPLPEPVLRRGLRVRTNGNVQIVDLIVQSLRDPAALRGLLMVVFHDQPTPQRRRGKTAKTASSDSPEQLEQEAQQLREALQTTREEMQTSQEELKSANEELQSTNEELQSTNEELTTSKEEMQSLNEELQTVNAELQAKVEELRGPIMT